VFSLLSPIHIAINQVVCGEGVAWLVGGGGGVVAVVRGGFCQREGGTANKE